MITTLDGLIEQQEKVLEALKTLAAAASEQGKTVTLELNDLRNYAIIKENGGYGGYIDIIRGAIEPL